MTKKKYESYFLPLILKIYETPNLEHLETAIMRKKMNLNE
jgi:hypothetical protein